MAHYSSVIVKIALEDLDDEGHEMLGKLLAHIRGSKQAKKDIDSPDIRKVAKEYAAETDPTAKYPYANRTNS